MGKVTVVLYSADGKKLSTKEGKLGDKLLKGVQLKAGQSVEVRARACCDLAGSLGQMRPTMGCQQGQQQQKPPAVTRRFARCCCRCRSRRCCLALQPSRSRRC